MGVVACRPVIPRLWKFHVWLLYNICIVAPCRMVWRVLQCPNQQVISRQKLLLDDV